MKASVIAVVCGALGVTGCQSAVVPAAANGPVDPGAGSAAGALAMLQVRPNGPMSAYDRLRDFGVAWTDATSAPGGRNRCDTRNDILRRDLTRVRLTGSCTVVSGVLTDPYTGRTISFRRGRATSSAVQIDHLVALGNAWGADAATMPPTLRRELANDPLNLVSVDGPTNEGKGDDDASRWLPPTTGYRCAYVARQIAVKTKYGLSVTGAEQTAMQRVLDACPQQKLPTETSPEVRLPS